MFCLENHMSRSGTKGARRLLLGYEFGFWRATTTRTHHSTEPVAHQHRDFLPISQFLKVMACSPLQPIRHSIRKSENFSLITEGAMGMRIGSHKLLRLGEQKQGGCPQKRALEVSLHDQLVGCVPTNCFCMQWNLSVRDACQLSNTRVLLLDPRHELVLTHLARSDRRNCERQRVETSRHASERSKLFSIEDKRPCLN